MIMMTAITNVMYWWIYLYLIHFSVILAQCIGNGLNGCACNFIGACKWNAKTNTFGTFTGRNLKTFIPKVESFAITSQVAEICESGSIGIVYDCVNLIPLASTAVFKSDEYYAKYRRSSKHFKQSHLIGTNFQQHDKDYEQAMRHQPCYKATNSKYYVEHNWSRGNTPYARKGRKACDHKISIHRGHLIAAQYRPTINEITFVFTNAIPQFGAVNSGGWNQFERKTLEWARGNCHSAPVHIIVGVIPSTYGKNDHRFVGEAGFSNYRGPSRLFPGKRPYRINVVAFTYAAACCQTQSFTKNTGFYSPNRPGLKLVRSCKLSELFLAMRAGYVELFPGEPKCTDDKHFVRL